MRRFPWAPREEAVTLRHSGRQGKGIGEPVGIPAQAGPSTREVSGAPFREQAALHTIGCPPVLHVLAMYLMAQLVKPFVRRSLAIHLGPTLFSGPWGPLREAMAVLLVFWLICYWLYRQKFFIKI